MGAGIWGLANLPTPMLPRRLFVSLSSTPCVQAVTAALREREAALLTVQSIEDDLERRRRAVAALEEAGPRRCVMWGRGGGGGGCRTALQLDM